MTRPTQPLIHVSVAVVEKSRLLLVREKKPSVAGKWNLPGGHIERGESILIAARRELFEETGLTAEPESLTGIYSGPKSIRFVFWAQRGGQALTIGADVQAAEFFRLDEVWEWPAKQWVDPVMLHAILADIRAIKRSPLTSFVHLTV